MTQEANQPVSRRREIGSASARSLLLTVLGEFVHPRHTSVWTATLLESLGVLGVEEKSARQALTRAANEGLLTSDPPRPAGPLGADPHRAPTCSRRAPDASTASCARAMRGTDAGWC